MPRADLQGARDAADQFRAQYVAGQSYDKMPLDVIFVADVKLRLDLVPYPKLSEQFDTEAAITPDFRTIYVDEDAYAHYDSKTSHSWQRNRLRFSVAHELGHMMLHGEVAARAKFNSFDDMRQWFLTGDGQLRLLEQEANEFAGRLLVPVKLLKDALDGWVALKNDPKWRDSAELREAFAKWVEPKFGLHYQGVMTRLDRENLWPSDWIAGG